jgi:hypothetical protein
MVVLEVVASHLTLKEQEASVHRWPGLLLCSNSFLEVGASAALTITFPQKCVTDFVSVR